MEKIEGLNLRNLAGRVAYDSHNGYTLIMTHERGDTPYITSLAMLDQFDLPESERQFVPSRPLTQAHKEWVGFMGGMSHTLVDAISSSTKIYIDVEKLPTCDDIESLPEGWFNLPFQHLWLDIKWNNDLYSLFLMKSDDGKIHFFRYRYMKDYAGYRKLTGSKHLTILDIYAYLDNIDGIPHAACIKPAGDTKVCFSLYDEYPEMVNEEGGLIIDVLFTLNCVSNVTLEKVAPANKVPKYARKYPRLDYHVLKLRKAKSTTSPPLEYQLRKSPRQHLRRGHLRQYRPGKYTFVPHCMIGSFNNGNIVKDYLV